MDIIIRRAKLEDSTRCAEIFYEAFTGIAREHNFPPEVTPPDTNLESDWSKRFLNPSYYVVVAELEGSVVGLNVLDERDPIAGIGPLTVDPAVQDKRVGRRLMEDVLKRVDEMGHPGVRLVQAAYNRRSLVLYAKLGFDVRDLLVTLQGQPLGLEIPGHYVRPATGRDLERCNELCLLTHGHERSEALLDAIAKSKASIVERKGRIAGYASFIGFGGHAVGESNDALKALIGAAPEFEGPAGFLLPVRNGELFRWCLENDLRVVVPMTLMTRGLYNEPASPFLPSIFY